MLFGHEVKTRHEYKTIKNLQGKKQVFGAGFVDKTGIRVNFEKVFWEDYVLVVILRGEGVYIDEETGKKYPLKAGNYFQRFPNKVHTVILDPDSNWYEFFIAVPSSLFDLLDNMKGVNSSEIVGNIAMTSKLFDRFIAYADMVSSVSDSEIYTLLPEACAIITDCINGIEKQNVISEFMLNSKKYLEKTYNKKSDIEEYCRKNGCSYVSFRTKFKRQFGMSPYQYRIHVRMDKAVELLCNLDYSIKDIASILGYSTQYEFSNHFKKYFSISPSKFRKNRIETMKSVLQK